MESQSENESVSEREEEEEEEGGDDASMGLYDAFDSILACVEQCALETMPYCNDIAVLLIAVRYALEIGQEPFARNFAVPFPRESDGAAVFRDCVPIVPDAYICDLKADIVTALTSTLRICSEAIAVRWWSSLCSPITIREKRRRTPPDIAFLVNPYTLLCPERKDRYIDRCDNERWLWIASYAQTQTHAHAYENITAARLKIVFPDIYYEDAQYTVLAKQLAEKQRDAFVDIMLYACGGSAYAQDRWQKVVPAMCAPQPQQEQQQQRKYVWRSIFRVSLPCWSSFIANANANTNAQRIPIAHLRIILSRIIFMFPPSNYKDAYVPHMQNILTRLTNIQKTSKGADELANARTLLSLLEPFPGAIGALRDLGAPFVSSLHEENKDVRSVLSPTSAQLTGAMLPLRQGQCVFLARLWFLLFVSSYLDPHERRDAFCAFIRVVDPVYALLRDMSGNERSAEQRLQTLPQLTMPICRWLNKKDRNPQNKYPPTFVINCKKTVRRFLYWFATCKNELPTDDEWRYDFYAFYLSGVPPQLTPQRTTTKMKVDTTAATTTTTAHKEQMRLRARVRATERNTHIWYRSECYFDASNYQKSVTVTKRSTFGFVQNSNAVLYDL